MIPAVGRVAAVLRAVADVKVAGVARFQRQRSRQVPSVACVRGGYAADRNLRVEIVALGLVVHEAVPRLAVLRRAGREPSVVPQKRGVRRCVERSSRRADAAAAVAESNLDPVPARPSRRIGSILDLVPCLGTEDFRLRAARRSEIDITGVVVILGEGVGRSRRQTHDALVGDRRVRSDRVGRAAGRRRDGRIPRLYRQKNRALRNDDAVLRRIARRHVLARIYGLVEALRTRAFDCGRMENRKNGASCQQRLDADMTICSCHFVNPPLVLLGIIPYLCNKGEYTKV